MPPKNKKQLQQQAKRLEQQQRKKQQEQRRLQQQRKKYAAQTLNTNLILPISNQLIADFTSQQSAFIKGKFKEVLEKLYPDLKDQRITNQIMKEMLYIIKNSRKLFELNDIQTFEQSKQKYEKVRIVCGIYLQVYLNNHCEISRQQQKNKENDENLIKQLIINHSQSKNEKQKKVFNKNQVLLVLKFFKQNYFNHYLILHKFNKFSKRQDEKTFNIYIASPNIEFNSVHTRFIDLSNRNGNNQQGLDNEDRKSDGIND